MNRLIAIVCTVVIISILGIIAVCYLPYGIGYLQTVKKTL